MLHVKDLYYSIGDLDILTGINWVIKPGKRAALIGSNGAGKTTLLRIITQELKEYSGEITRPGNYKIGYLPQEEIVLENQQVITTVLEGQKETQDLKQRIESIYHSLEGMDRDHEPLLKRLARLEQRYESMEGYTLELKARSILSGLGFSETDFTRSLQEFSGGWKMRVYLARLLILDPDLLLLDEPTNHLDLPSLEWLEQYLLNFSHSMVIVSHDRFFIDRIAGEIYELESGKLQYYPGKYHLYEQKKAEQLACLKKQKDKQLREKQHLQNYIDRFRYKATKASQAQSKIKQLNKMDDIMLPPSPRSFRFNLNVATTSFNHVLSIKNLSFKYQQDWILQNVDLDIYREEKVSVVGLNGAGKTTLTRLIAGQLKPVSGSLSLGERSHIGYYSQHQIESLAPASTVYDEVYSTIDSQHVPVLRDILGIFQFNGDDIHKKISVLSGGEKARVSLVKILLSPVNFLIMDEPTNHLDRISREALEQALIKYTGTLMLISHDRYFLDKIIHRVIEIKDKQIIDYPGNYTEYLEKREKKKQDENIPPRISPVQGAGKDRRKQEKQIQARARQAISKERNQLEQKVKEGEIKIEELEQAIKEVEHGMADSRTYENRQKITELGKIHASLKKELQIQYASWEANQLMLEDLLNRLRRD